MSDSDSFAQYDLIASYVIFHHENEESYFFQTTRFVQFSKNGHKSSSVHAGESLLKYFW